MSVIYLLGLLGRLLMNFRCGRLNDNNDDNNVSL